MARLIERELHTYTIDDVLPLLKQVRKSGGNHYFLCPVHEDHAPSASMRKGDSVEIVFKCHAGCTFSQFVAVLQNPDTRQDAAAPTSAPNEKLNLVAEYRYKNADGSPFATKKRLVVASTGRKTFAWSPPLEGAEAPVYRLDAIQGKEAVLIVEGEKDADALVALGIPATCSPHGASKNTQQSKWLESYTNQIVSAGVQMVFLLADNDDAGRAHRLATAASLHVAGTEVRLVDLPGLSESGDVSDWLAAGNTKDALRELCKATPVWSPPAGTVEAKPKLQTMAETQARIGKHVEWVVDRWFAAGDLSMLIALPGEGKSTFYAHLAYCVSRGLPFLGHKTVQHTVVYLAFEGARSIIAQLSKLGHQPDDPRILFWIDEGNPQDPLPWLEGVVAGLTGPLFIIVEALGDFSTIKAGASNAGYEEIYSKMGPIYRWAQSRHYHVSLSHHAGKGGRGGVESALGSIGNVGKPGTVLYYRHLVQFKQDSPRVIEGVKHREGDLAADWPATVLEYDRNTGQLSVGGCLDEIRLKAAGLAFIKEVERAGPVGALHSVLMSQGKKPTNLEVVQALETARPAILARDGAGTRTLPFRWRVVDGQADPKRAWLDLVRERFANIPVPAGPERAGPEYCAGSEQEDGPILDLKDSGPGTSSAAGPECSPLENAPRPSQDSGPGGPVSPTRRSPSPQWDAAVARAQGRVR